MRLPTYNEKIKAIQDTVPAVAEFLEQIGKIEAFNDFTKDDICGLIRTCQEGVQRSLHLQIEGGFDNLNQEIPF